MCAGRPPFRADAPYGILRKITDTQPREIRAINPEVPDWLEAIIAKLHAKSAEDRFTTAEDVAELLRQCLAHVQQPTSVALPEQCTSPRKWPDRGRPGLQSSTSHGPLIANRLARCLVGALVVACVLIAGLGLLPKLSAPPDTKTGKAASAEDASPHVPRDEDPNIAWDATSNEIAQLLQDARPFEEQANQL